MGQRHQQFIRTLNPNKYAHNAQGFEMFDKRKKTVILPFHNQWLYGRSAPLTALRILEHIQEIPQDSRKGKKDLCVRDSSIFGSGGLSHNFNLTFEKYISTVEFILNYSPKSEYGVTMPGMNSSWFLDRQDLEYYELMAKDFTMGDNNDGITIIDTINMKYCFMNISNYGNDGEISQSVNDLKAFEPVGALDYMNAYYPVEINKFSKYYTEQNSVDVLREMAVNNSKLNTEIGERFYPFQVLTESEVKKMFPKVYEKRADTIK